MRPVDLSPADCARLPFPQPDSRDTDLLLALAEARWGKPPERTGLVLFATGPCVRPIPMPVSPTLVDAFDGSGVIADRLDAIAGTMARWPEGAAGFSRFVDAFWPLWMAPRPTSVVKGCSSGHLVLPDGTRGVYVTIDDVEGCCEGLMHEWGHLRLETLGVDIESHDGSLLANHNGEVYESPIRRDKLRPMSAVLHGFYAWALLTAMDVRQAEAGNLAGVRCFLEGNLPKLEEGLLTLTAKARWTDRGEGFWAALREGAVDLVRRGWALLGDPDRTPFYRRHREWIEAQPVAFSRLHHAAADVVHDVLGPLSSGDLS